MKMKVFRQFNLTPLGIILHMVAILIVLRCCQWQPSVVTVYGKVKKLAYLAGYWLDLAKIRYNGLFLDSKSKINNKILI